MEKICFEIEQRRPLSDVFSCPKENLLSFAQILGFQIPFYGETCYCLRVKVVPEQTFDSHSYSPVWASFPQFK